MRANAPRCQLCKVFADGLVPSWHPEYPHAIVDRKKLSEDELDQREAAAVTLYSWPHPQTPSEAMYLLAYLNHSGLDHGLCTVRIYRAPLEGGYLGSEPGASLS